MGKTWTCSRVFECDAQDISLWGLMHGDYTKNYGTHYLSPSAWPTVHRYVDKEENLPDCRFPLVACFPICCYDLFEAPCDDKRRDRIVGP